MDVTDCQQLPYPEPNDPADGALQLQVLAEAIDEKLVDLFAGFRAALNRPTLVIRRNTNQTGISNGVSTQVTFNETVYATSGLSTSARFTETGYYRIGHYINAAPSGGVTANSVLRATLTFRQQLPVPYLTVITDDTISDAYQSGTGSEGLTNESLIRVASIETPGSTIRSTVYHENAASTLTVFAGSLMWFYKVCDLEI